MLNFRTVGFLILLLSLLTATGQPADTPYLIVLNKSEHTAWQINAETGEKIKSYKTGRGPHEVAVSPDKNRAVITNYGGKSPDHTLTVLNLGKRSVEKTINLSPYTRPHGIEWFADSRRVIVTSETQKAVLVVDVLKSRVLRALPTGQNLSHMVALTSDNRKAYATNIASGSVSVIDLQADSVNQPSDIITTEKGTEGLQLLETTGMGWFSNRAANTISVVDLKNHQHEDTLESAGFPIRLAADPNQRWVAATHAKSSEVAIFDARNRQPITRILLKQKEKAPEKRFIGDQFGEGAVPIGVTFSDDSQHLFVSASQADVIAVIETDSWSVARTIPTGTEPDGIAFFRR